MIRVGSITIPNGGTASDPLDGHLIRWATALYVHPPAALAGTVTVEVAPRRPSTVQAADWRALESEGTPIEVTAGQTLPLIATGFGSIRVSTTVAPGVGGEEFEITIEER